MVGVKGGATGRCFLVGVLGSAGSAGSGLGTAFLFLLFSFGGGGAATTAAGFEVSAASWALMRAERRVAAIAACEDVLNLDVVVSGLDAMARDLA